MGSRFTVHGKKVFTSRATRTGVLEDRNTSKFRISPSISSSGSTSLVVGIFFDILQRRHKWKRPLMSLLERQSACNLIFVIYKNNEHITHLVLTVFFLKKRKRNKRSSLVTSAEVRIILPLSRGRIWAEKTEEGKQPLFQVYHTVVTTSQ